MKRSRILALVLVVAIMVMGAGYAYWSEDLKVNNTVKTGEMDVKFQYCFDDDYDDKRPRDKDYVDVESYLDDEGNNLTFTLNDVYPGSGGWLRFKIANTGTVPAKLKEITYKITEDTADMQTVFNYKIQSLVLYKPVKFGPFEWESRQLIYDPIYEDNLQDFVTALQTKLSEYTLEPYAYFEINGESTGYDIQLPGTVTDDKYEANEDNENGQEFSFELGLKFEQAH